MEIHPTFRAAGGNSRLFLVAHDAELNRVLALNTNRAQDPFSSGRTTCSSKEPLARQPCEAPQTLNARRYVGHTWRWRTSCTLHAALSFCSSDLGPSDRGVSMGARIVHKRSSTSILARDYVRHATRTHTSTAIEYILPTQQSRRGYHEANQTAQEAP